MRLHIGDNFKDCFRGQLVSWPKRQTCAQHPFLEVVFFPEKNVLSCFFCVCNIKKMASTNYLEKYIKKATFLQEAAIAAVSGEDAAEPQEEEGMPSGFGSTSSLPGSHSNGGEDSEVARFGAVKEKKHSLENGISVFNRCSLACVS